MKDILAYLQGHTNDIVTDIETLVRIESPSRHAAGINRIQDVTESWLSPLGSVTRHASDFGDILHAHIRGASEERIVLLAHLDTVYPMGSWKDLWWVEGEHAFGPGTYDMKAGTVLALWALRALRSSGRMPACSVDLLLTPDEEIGSDAARPYIEELAQGAQAVLVLESPYMNGDLKIARKGVGDYRVDVFGKAAHQGLEPERGRNAIVSAAYLINHMMSLADPSKGTTIGPNVLHGGTVSNVVADHAVLEVDLRAWTLPEAERVDAALRAITPLEGTRYEFTGGLNRPPMEPSDGTMQLFERAKTLALEIGFEVGAARVGGGSDGNFTSQLAPTLDGFGAVGAHAHQKDLEHIHIPSLAPRTALLAGMLLQDFRIERVTTRLYLIRHGATPLTMEDRFSGAEGVHLSDEGRAQAARLADRLADQTIAAAYSSPLERAMETAELLARPHALTPQLVDGLREISHGHWEGLTRREVEMRFSEEYADWEEDPFTFAPEGGESGISVLSRALPALRQIVVRHRDQNVLVVSHKATLRLLISSLLGFDARGYRDRLDQAPACLNIVDFMDAVRARLMLFNDTSHYAPQPLRPEHHLSKWWDAPEAPASG